MIKIYYNNNTTDQSTVTEKAIVRLLAEGCDETDITQAIGADGIQYVHLADVDSSLFNCEEAERMLADGEVHYVIEIDEDGERFYYIG